jgi:DinB superfamily
MPNTTRISRPNPDEHIAYYGRYISLVPDGDLVTELSSEIGNTAALLRASSDRADFAYAPGKWTVKEVVGHLADTERVMGFRALWFARGDAQPLPGFDENAWVPSGRFADRTLGDLAEEFAAVRASTLAMARGLATESLARRGTANGAEISVRALLYIIAGHERHHVALLKEKYGLA